MSNNLGWIKEHAQHIADLAGVEHPEIIDWCKAMHDGADMMLGLVAKMKGLI